MNSRTRRAAVIGSLAVLVFFSFSLVHAAPAAAFERQHHFGLGPNLAILQVDDKSTASIGAGVGMHYTYGLSDQFNLMVEGGSSIVAANERLDHPNTPHTRPATVTALGAGVGYVIDILRWVPYVGVLGSGYVLGGGTLDQPIFVLGAQLGGGLDYQINRSWAVGIAVRQHFLATKMSTYPSYTTGFLRAEYVWGW